ncbi:MAG: ribulose 1,5-bisphosphate carboxylase large subunit [Candidatus Brocadiae bacterium]|nr:ribulose 1,5-bisphosphate carboxylase large subunit [Candidatus Brocadiia bacterium]
MIEKFLSGERFSVFYKLRGTEKDAIGIAEDICLEQTVEFPRHLIQNKTILDHVVGRIESFEKIEENSFRAKISFAIETSAQELTQLLNVIFGNISIKPNIQVERICLPQALLKHFPGPRFGREGLREKVSIYNRPLLATALKPMGLTSKELAELCYQFAMGGIDIIKDDHGISNQIFAPFEERVALCAQAVQKANAKTGYKCLYAANITSPIDTLMERALYAKNTGAGAIMLAPALVGFDTLRWISEQDNIGLPLISHPAFEGSYVLGTTGISHFALLGQITRLSGADATIYPNFGGRFSFSKEECKSIAQGTSVDMHHIKPIFPTPGGGMSLELIPELIGVYGKDVIYLVGAGLFKRSSNLVENSSYFRQMVEKSFPSY